VADACVGVGVGVGVGCWIRVERACLLAYGPILDALRSALPSFADALASDLAF